MKKNDRQSPVPRRRALLFAALLLSLTLGAAKTANAETVPGTFGNTTGTPATVSGIGITGATGAGTSRAVKQEFDVAQIETPSALYLPIWYETTNQTINIKICTNSPPDELDPCIFPLFETDYVPIQTTRAGAFANPATFALEGIEFFPGISYVIVLERESGTGTDFSRIAFTDGTYADGELWNRLNGCSGDPWVKTSNTASSCSGTEWDGYDIFFGFQTINGLLTIDLIANGANVNASGFCIEPEDLPNGWILNTNTVFIKYKDTSASGTFMLNEANCNNGTYTITQPLWNGTFLITAEQQGTPVSFSDSATTTINITGNPNQNPVDFLSICDDWTLEDITSVNGFRNQAACNLSAAANSFLGPIAPFKWWNQIRGITATSSSTSTISIGVPLEQFQWQQTTTTSFIFAGTTPTLSSTVVLFDSATDSGAADQAASEVPYIRTFWVIVLWVEVAFWMAGLIWLFIRQL